jgi:hypothetical protein
MPLRTWALVVLLVLFLAAGVVAVINWPSSPCGPGSTNHACGGLDAVGVGHLAEPLGYLAGGLLDTTSKR